MKLKMKAGNYFIGQFNNILNGEQTLLADDETDFFTDEGIFTISYKDKEMEFASFMAENDGTFEDNYGNEITTTDGQIGCISTEYFDAKEIKHLADNIHTFKDDFYVEFKNGKMTFGDHVIDTNTEEDHSLDKYYEEE
jgi:hypothetical protein